MDVDVVSLRFAALFGLGHALMGKLAKMAKSNGGRLGLLVSRTKNGDLHDHGSQL